MVQKFPGTIQQILEKVEWQKIPTKNFSIPREVVLFLEILENAVPFATRSCRKINKAFPLVIVFKTVGVLSWTLYTVKKHALYLSGREFTISLKARTLFWRHLMEMRPPFFVDIRATRWSSCLQDKGSTFVSQLF